MVSVVQVDRAGQEERQMNRIRTLAKLQWAALNKKSVVCPKILNWGTKPRPAAFVINLQGRILLRYFESGMYFYERKGK